jgi:hypothetical protein
LHVRVEPELLFGALAEVNESYGRDPATADARLDDLMAPTAPAAGKAAATGAGTSFVA